MSENMIPEGEPNTADFEAHGLKCAIRRSSDMGNLAGYAAVASEHPWHGKDFHDGGPEVVRVHGGLTWAEDHLPHQGCDGWWWFGFDCAHDNDDTPEPLSECTEMRNSMDPIMVELFPWRDIPDRGYRDMPYVRAECEKLAEQLAKAAE